MIPDKIIEGLSGEWVVWKSDENSIHNGPRIIQISQNTVTALIYNGDDDIKEGTLDDDHKKAMDFCISVLEELIDKGELVIVEKLLPEEINEDMLNNHPGSDAVLLFLQITHPDYIKKVAVGGGNYAAYVPISYMTRALNYVFKNTVNEEHLESTIDEINGKIYYTVLIKFSADFYNTEGVVVRTITKDVHGSFRLRGKMEPGNAWKAAASDALKNFGYKLGVSQDVKGQEVDLSFIEEA